MHNLWKIKIFRYLLLATYPVAVVFVYPFALLKRKNNSKYFFFLDRYVIGGAQKVHIDILNAMADVHKQVYFTRLSTNDKLKTEFYNIPKTACKDIHTWCDNLLFRLFTVHYYAFYINRHREAFVFSSNSTFFYDMLFFLNKRTQTTELLHNFTHGNNGMEFFGLANYKYLTHRLTVDAATKENIAHQYKQYDIPAEYTKRVLMIEPGVEIPSSLFKDYTLPLKVLYAGRGTPQKRIYLLDKIAERCIKDGLQIEFHFAGTMMDELSVFVKQHSVIHGEISSAADMYKLYNNSHAILMTSAYEGFPMLIKEGMANGCIPVVTALDGNKSHLRHGQNSLLIDHPQDEDGVVTQGIKLLKELAANNDSLQQLSESCYNYAVANFAIDVFKNKYRQFFGLN